MRGATIIWTSIAVPIACATGVSAQEPALAERPDVAYVLELTWDAPPECPDAAAIDADLARIVSGLPDHEPPELTADGRIVRERGGYRLLLRTVRDGIAGERSLFADRCEDLESTTGLLLALSLGDGVELRAPPDPPAPPTTELTVPSLPEQEAPTPLAGPPPEPLPEPALSVTIGVEVGVGWGVLPNVAPRVALTASVGTTDARARLRAGSDVYADLSVTPDVGAQLSSGDVGLGACWLPALGPLRGDFCAQATLVATWARSQGTSRDGEAIAAHVQLGLTLGASLPLSDGLSLRLLGEGAVATSNPRFTIEGLGDVHQVDPVRLSAVLGLEARLN